MPISRSTMFVIYVMRILALLLLIPSVVPAGTLKGVVQGLVEPYILLKTETGYEIVRLIEGAPLGNIDTLGVVKYGGTAVEIEWERESNRVKQATRLVRLPIFSATPAIEIPAEQAATWQALESGPDRHLMIDVRDQETWAEGHILRSLSVPFNRSAGQYAPYPKNIEQGIVLYGAGNQSELPHRAAQRAIASGYEKIRVYSGGVDDWSRRGKPLGITAAGVKRRLDRNETVLILDIRGEEEWRSGHISGSISVPFSTFLPDMLSVRDRHVPFPVLLVGHSEQEALKLFSVRNWGRSYKAPVYLLEGGFAAWQGSGYPVATDGVSYSAADLLPPGEIGPDELRTIWNKGGQGSPLLLDVRTDDAPAPTGHKKIPLHELEYRLPELPVDRELIVYCYTGTRSAIAYHLLQNNGYRVRFYNRSVRTGENGQLLE